MSTSHLTVVIKINGGMVSAPMDHVLNHSNITHSLGVVHRSMLRFHVCVQMLIFAAIIFSKLITGLYIFEYSGSHDAYLNTYLGSYRSHDA